MALSGSGGQGGAIRAGQAFVELSASDKSLLAALDRAKARVQAFGATVARAGAGLAAGGASILAPITGLFAAAVERGASLDDLARQLGTTVESVSGLGYAFETAGLQMEQFADLAKSLDQKLSQALDGNDEAATAFRRLGLSAAEVARMDLPERLETVGNALNRVTLASDRSEFALKLLGGSGAKALRIFERGPGTLGRLADQARDVGAIMSGETARSAVEVSRAFNQAWSSIKYAALAVGEALLPNAEAIKEVSRAVVNVARQVREWIGRNQFLVTTVVAVGAALVVAGGALVGLGGAITLAGTAIGGIATAFSALFTAVSLVVSPLAVIPVALAAIAGTGYLLATQTEAGQALTETIGTELTTAWRTMADAAVESWAGIASAMRRGDLAAAGEIALAGLTIAWQQALLSIRTLWEGFKRYLGDSWSVITAGFRMAFVDAAEGIKSVFAELVQSLLGMAGRLAGALGKDQLAADIDDFAAAARRSGELDARIADRRRKQITDELMRDVAARAEAAGEALAGPRMALEEARARLAELLAAEGARAPLAAAGASLGGRQIPDVVQLARSARGLFQGQIAAGLGAGDSVAQRQLQAALDGNKKLDEIKDVIRKKEGPVFDG